MDSSEHIKRTAKLHHRRTIVNELYSHFFGGTVIRFLKKRMCKAQFTIDHMDVGVPLQSACYQRSAHFGCRDRQKNLQKWPLRPVHLNLKFRNGLPEVSL